MQLGPSTAPVNAYQRLVSVDNAANLHDLSGPDSALEETPNIPSLESDERGLFSIQIDQSARWRPASSVVSLPVMRT